jgi:hypothetical protein
LKEIEDTFKQREKVLDLMDENLETRENSFTPPSEKYFDIFLKCVRSIFK